MQPTVMAPVCASGGIICYGRSYRTTFFPDFSLFFFQEKQEIFSNLAKLWKFNGNISGTLGIPMFGLLFFEKIWKLKKIARKKYRNLGQKVLR